MINEGKTLTVDSLTFSPPCIRIVYIQRDRQRDYNNRGDKRKTQVKANRFKEDVSLHLSSTFRA